VPPLAAIDQLASRSFDAHLLEWTDAHIASTYGAGQYESYTFVRHSHQFSLVSSSQSMDHSLNMIGMSVSERRRDSIVYAFFQWLSGFFISCCLGLPLWVQLLVFRCLSVRYGFRVYSDGNRCRIVYRFANTNDLQLGKRVSAEPQQRSTATEIRQIPSKVAACSRLSFALARWANQARPSALQIAGARVLTSGRTRREACAQAADQARLVRWRVAYAGNDRGVRPGWLSQSWLSRQLS